MVQHLGLRVEDLGFSDIPSFLLRDPLCLKV